MICEICGREVKNGALLSRHLGKYHNEVSKKDYYDKYLKIDQNEGICPVCGKPTFFLNLVLGYRDHCSTSCSNKDDNVQNKCKATRFIHYGDENFRNMDKVRATKFERYGDENYNNIEKIKSTTYEHYGVEFGLANKEIYEKGRQTKLEKYGDPNYNNWEKAQETNQEKYNCKAPMQNEEIKNKAIQTNIEKYGVENTFQVKEFIEKGRQTKLEKYGDVNYNNPEKSKQTCNERYGVDYSFQSENNQEKSKQTFLKNFGVEYPAQVPEIQQKIQENNKKTLNERYGVDYNFQIPEVRSKASKKYTYDDVQFDSSWELALWIYAKDHNEEIEREPCYFDYYEDNKKHRYFPDFKYKGKLVEIKGDQFFNENVKFKLNSGKLQCIIDNGIEIWKQNEIQPFLNYIKNKYDKNYLKQFKNK